MSAGRIRQGELDLGALVTKVATIDDGAIATFLGTARRFSEGKEVEELRYEAYPEMAEKVLAEILAAVPQRFPGARAEAHHRLGICPLGEASVAVAAAAPHRKEAFAACRYVIDALKSQAPIWKQEVYSDGTRWIGDPDRPCSHEHGSVDDAGVDSPKHAQGS
jgi:molybdopterin synthase catalytic subunit